MWVEEARCRQLHSLLKRFDSSALKLNLLALPFEVFLREVKPVSLQNVPLMT